MKTKDKKELFTKTASELKKLLDEAKKSVVSLKFDHQQNKLKDTRSIFNKGKEVAILKSIINIKEKMETLEKTVEKEVKTVIKKANPSVAKALDGKGGKK